MPVVSKGEFTVSRLDDGVSSHLHVGWLMADDRFTTIYPAENLWVKSSSASGYLVANGTVVGPDAFNRVSDYIPITPGKKYIYQTDVIVSKEDKLQSWNGLCFYDASKALVGARLVQQGSTVAVGTKVHTEWPLTAPAGASFIRIGSRYLEDGVAKFESGATPTIYTPAPADDYSLAYPKYRGEYTDTIAADSTDPNRYTWTAYLGEQGPPTGIISQNTVPSSPYVGMLWQCTGNIAGYINPATYRWNGSAWEIYQFTAQNILAETFTGFVFQGVEFIGSRFVNEWTDSQAGNTGRMQIADGELTSDYWLTGSGDENNTSGGHFSISRDGILTSTWKNETVNQSRGYVLTDQFLEFFYNGRSDLNGSGRLTALQLTNVPWTNLPYESGFTTAENNPCQYRVVHLLDGSRELQMRGQVQNTGGTALPTATSPYIGLLPATARPIRNELVAAADSSRKGARVAVLKNGYIQIDTPNANTTYVSLGGIRILLE